VLIESLSFVLGANQIVGPVSKVEAVSHAADCCIVLRGSPARTDGQAKTVSFLGNVISRDFIRLG